MRLGQDPAGLSFVFQTDELMLRYVINFPTKRHWRSRSRLGDIKIGLSALVMEIERRRIHSMRCRRLAADSAASTGRT